MRGDLVRLDHERFAWLTRGPTIIFDGDRFQSGRRQFERKPIPVVVASPDWHAGLGLRLAHEAKPY